MPARVVQSKVQLTSIVAAGPLANDFLVEFIPSNFSFTMLPEWQGELVCAKLYFTNNLSVPVRATEPLDQSSGAPVFRDRLRPVVKAPPSASQTTSLEGSATNRTASTASRRFASTKRCFGLTTTTTATTAMTTITTGGADSIGEAGTPIDGDLGARKGQPRSTPASGGTGGCQLSDAVWSRTVRLHRLVLLRHSGVHGITAADWFLLPGRSSRPTGRNGIPQKSTASSAWAGLMQAQLAGFAETRGLSSSSGGGFGVGLVLGELHAWGSLRDVFGSTCWRQVGRSPKPGVLRRASLSTEGRDDAGVEACITSIVLKMSTSLASGLSYLHSGNSSLVPLLADTFARLSSA